VGDPNIHELTLSSFNSWHSDCLAPMLDGWQEWIVTHIPPPPYLFKSPYPHPVGQPHLRTFNCTSRGLSGEAAVKKVTERCEGYGGM